MTKRIIEDIKDMACKDIKVTIKTDQEAAIREVQEEVRRKREEATVLENSPVGETSSNGFIERQIQKLQGHFRTLKSALEKGAKCKVSTDSDIAAWMIEWAAMTINRYEKGSDGLTAWEKVRGRRSNAPIAIFGEYVAYNHMKGTSMRSCKAEDRVEMGVWLGQVCRTGENIIGTPKGTIKARSVRRLDNEQRWNFEAIASMGGTPWEPVPGKKGDRIPTEVREEQGDKMDEDDVDEGVEEGVKHNADDFEEENEATEQEEEMRNFYITKGMVKKHGVTLGCKGCKAAIESKRGILHTRTCRERFTKLVTEDGDPHVKNRLDKYE